MNGCEGIFGARIPEEPEAQISEKNILVGLFSEWVFKDCTNKRVCIVGTHEKATGRNKLLAQDVMNDMILAHVGGSLSC